MMLILTASLLYLDRLNLRQAGLVSAVLGPSLLNAMLGYYAGGTANYKAKSR